MAHMHANQCLSNVNAAVSCYMLNDCRVAEMLICIFAQAPSVSPVRHNIHNLVTALFCNIAVEGHGAVDMFAPLEHDVDVKLCCNFDKRIKYQFCDFHRTLLSDVVTDHFGCRASDKQVFSRNKKICICKIFNQSIDIILQSCKLSVHVCHLHIQYSAKYRQYHSPARSRSLSPPWPAYLSCYAVLSLLPKSCRVQGHSGCPLLY